MGASDTDDILSAASRLVDAFGRHRRDDYFACFAPDATFIFYTTPTVLASRAAYEAEFTAWEADGFRVLECHSRDPLVQLAGDVGIFTHRVSTLASTAGVETRTDERETIVFRRQADGGWIAIHEHLSPTPADQDA